MRDFPVRYLALIVAGFVFALSLILAMLLDIGWWLVILSGALTAVGIADISQTKRALLRNYRILAHFRYLLESIRPEIRQYFLEDDDAPNPFSRN